MVYPFIVLTASLVLSVLLAYVLEQLVWPSLTMISQRMSPGFHAALWMSPVVLALLLVAADHCVHRPGCPSAAPLARPVLS